MRSRSTPLVRDAAWTALGLGGVLVAMRVMEAVRPDVIADDFSAPENEVGRGELPRAYALSACSMVLGPVAGGARLPDVCGPVGLGIEVVAVALRVWAMRSLRGHYAHALRVVENQPVVRRGPYRFVRHPGYASALLAWVGAATCTRHAVPVGMTVLAVGSAYGHRMDAEETLLVRELPGYASYAASTGRLWPRAGARGWAA